MGGEIVAMQLIGKEFERLKAAHQEYEELVVAMAADQEAETSTEVNGRLPSASLRDSQEEEVGVEIDIAIEKENRKLIRAQKEVGANLHMCVYCTCINW